MGWIGADAPLIVFADGSENYQKEFQKLRVVAQTVVESVGSAEESDGSLADRLQKVPQKFSKYLLMLLGIV